MESLNGYYTRSQLNEKGEIEIIFTIKGGASRKRVTDIAKDCLYRIEITPIRSKRTVAQNNLMWSLINDIAMKTGNDSMDIYCECLERSEAKFTYLQGIADIENDLRKNFRAVKIINSFMNEKGNKICTYKCYLGSSKYDKREMASLLEAVIQLAEENDITVHELEY